MELFYKIIHEINECKENGMSDEEIKAKYQSYIDRKELTDDELKTLIS